MRLDEREALGGKLVPMRGLPQAPSVGVDGRLLESCYGFYWSFTVSDCEVQSVVEIVPVNEFSFTAHFSTLSSPFPPLEILVT